MRRVVIAEQEATAPNKDPLGAVHDAARGAIVVRGLSKRFGDRQALAPLDLDLGPGGIIGLLGPNGSGKSTFLRLLTGLVPRDSGRAWVDGVELQGDGTNVRERVSYAPGEIALYREQRASNHLDWLVRGRDARALARATELALALGLPLKKRVGTYSHGMKRQLMLCAALASDLRVRILDEPTEGLDPTKRGEVLELLRAQAREGRTLLLSSHHLGEVDRVCDRLVFLNEGRKIADERAADVQERARKLVRLSFERESEARELATRLDALGASRGSGPSAPIVASARVRDTRVLVELASDDPRSFLAHLGAPGGMPQPRTIEYGQMSLAELYRDLYGVEGC